MEKRGYRLAYNSLKAQYLNFIERSKSLDPNNWQDAADLINQEPIANFLKTFYRMAAPLALMQRKFSVGEKSAQTGIKYKAEGDNVYLSIYEQHMLYFLEQESATSIKTITATSQERIKALIRETLAQGEAEGLGIEAIRKRLEQNVGASLRGNVRARARAIAQTEMIKASNEASHFAVESTGLEYRKFWSSSHLPGTRVSHIEAEQDSIARGGLRKDEVHSNGLLHVGDPAGSVEEIVNCRCTELYEIV